MDLYGHLLSAPTREVLILCAELGVDCELTEVNQDEAIYLPEALNPLCKVPMIDDDGFMLAEVHAIQRYLVASRNADASIYPTAPQARAVADQWLDWQAFRLAPLSAQQLYCRYLNPQLPDAQAQLDAGAEQLNQLLPELELALSEGLVDGQTISLVTIALGVSLEQLIAGGFSLQPWPTIAQQLSQWSALPAFQATRPDEIS